MKRFNFRESTIDSKFNDIVEGGIKCVEMFANKEQHTKEYKDYLAAVNKACIKYSVSRDARFSALFEEKGTSIFKSPEITRDQEVRKLFRSIIAQIVNAAIPMTASRAWDNEFMDVVQTGWGETARFLVSSNDLFMVNEIGTGIRRGVLQPIFNDEITVNCSPIEVATDIDFYAVAAGNFDWGQFGFRAGRSFEGYILAKAVAGLVSATAELGSPYSAAGVDTLNWSTLADRIRTANSGSDVYAVGTLNALNSAIPDAVGLQYGLGKDVAEDGFLNKYLGVSLFPIEQAMVPGTVNSTAELAIPMNQIYMVAANGYKPVKVVFEGDSVVVEDIPDNTVDKTYRISIQMRIGVAVLAGSKFGTITLPTA